MIYDKRKVLDCHKKEINCMDF